jgi:pimeloyl-ACP methyl ester carboxylesterase
VKRYFITYKNQNVHLTEWGNPDKPVIFCIHGLGSTSLSFLEVADRLKDEFRIVAFDAPGHGKTGAFKSIEEYEMPRLADWLHGLIQYLDLGDFYLLSHSWGSFLALHYLVNYSENVIDTLLIDGGYQTKRIWASSMEEEMDHYEKDFDEYVFDSWDAFYNSEKENYMMWTPLKEVAVKDLAVERNGKFHWHARGETARHIIRGMHLNETEEIYHILPPGITLLVATLPEYLTEKRKQTAEAFKQSASGEVKLIDNTTHLLHWDSPDAVIEEITSKWYTKKGG